MSSRSVRIGPTGARLVMLRDDESGQPFTLPAGSSFSLIAELGDPNARGMAAAFQPAPLGGENVAYAAIVLFGLVGGRHVPLGRAFVTDSSPYPVHVMTCSGFGFEAYAIGVYSGSLPIRISAADVPASGPPSCIVDGRCSAQPLGFPAVAGLPGAGTVIPPLEGATEATLAAAKADLDNISANFPQIGPQVEASALPVTIASDDQVRTDVHTLATHSPALGAAASAAAMPVTIASDDQVRTDVHTVATRTPALGAAAMAGASPVTLASDDPARVDLDTIAARTPALAAAAAGYSFGLTNAAQQLTAAAVNRRLWLCFDLGQSGVCYVGKDNTVSNAGANAIDVLYPGDRIPYEYDNASRLWVVASAGTPTLRVRVE